jgi:hypothetical protein
MGFEPEVAPFGEEGNEGDEGDDENKGGSRGRRQCFDGRVPQTNGVFEAEKDTPDDLNDLFKRYRKSHAGKAASSLARALDTIPTWVILVFTLLVGAFIVLRVFVLTNSRRGGRRLGGGGGDGLSRFQHKGGKKGARVKDDFDDDSDGDEFFDASNGGTETAPITHNVNASKAFPKVDNW